MAWIIFKGSGTYTSGDLKLRQGKQEVPDDHPILDELRELDLEHIKIRDDEPEDVQSADEVEGAQPLAASGELSTEDFADPSGEPDPDPDPEPEPEPQPDQPTPEPDLAEGTADSNPATSPADPDESPGSTSDEAPGVAADEADGGVGADQTEPENELDTAESVQADAEPQDVPGDPAEAEEQPLDQAAYEATDAAEKHAKEAGIDISKVTGTGKDGKITAEDVDKAADTRSTPGALES